MGRRMYGTYANTQGVDDLEGCELLSCDQVVLTAADTIFDMTVFRTAAATAVLILMLAACGGDASTTEAAAPASDGAAETTPAGPAIEGSFPTVAGGQLDLGALAGQDTVLWFWAPW